MHEHESPDPWCGRYDNVGCRPTFPGGFTPSTHDERRCQ